MANDSYNPGDMVDVEDYGYVRDAWITPAGSMVYVPMCGHEHVARSLFGCHVSEAERAGYVHLSERCFVGGFDRLTEAQINTIMLYCAAHNRSTPTWCVDSYDAPVQKQDYSMSNKYKTGMMSNRKLRALFYPYNGD